MKRLLALIFFGLSLFITACISYDAPERRDGDTIFYDPSDEAFPNPIKGFRPSRHIPNTSFPSGEYVSTIHHLIKYTDLEYSANDTAQKIIDWSNKTWAGFENQNIKVIPRVMLVNPSYGKAGEYWPAGLGEGGDVGRWLTDELKERVAAFIAKLGAAWDNDPRIAAIEMGIWGYWGEQHIWPLVLPGAEGGDRIPPDIQKVMGDAFAQAFKNKKVMVRNPDRFLDYNFGCYWDSFGMPEDDTGDRIVGRDNWRDAMYSGEVAYDWGSQNIVGGSPNGTLGSDLSTDHMIYWARQTRTSSLGWVSDYSQNNPALKANAARLQKAMGYRFVVQSATYKQMINEDRKLQLEFKVANTGSAPFYYQWPVEASLLNARKVPVWTGIVHVDIRNWHPGNIYTVRDEFDIPENLPNGTYTLALAVLDPSGNLPSLRFANQNYYRGGRMPLGIIGIGGQPKGTLGIFDSLYSDRSLSYRLAPPSAPVEDRQDYSQIEEYVDPNPVSMPISGIGQKPGDLAYRKPVTVSSTEAAYDNYPEKAVDGNPGTRWSSEWDLDPSWIAVDLGTAASISRVGLSWESSFAAEYEIQVSDDGITWKTVYHNGAGKGGEENITFAAEEARYVRLFCIKRALRWGYSLYSLEVYQQ